MTNEQCPKSIVIDLFNVRNVGNLVPPATSDGLSQRDLSEAGAVEYAVLVLKVTDIIVCGHSECGAMKAVLAADSVPVNAPNLRKWLQDAPTAAERLTYDRAVDAGLKPHDRISQINVLVQLDHLASYPIVRDRVTAGTLHLHGWWFNVAAGSMLAYDPGENCFEQINRKMIKRMVKHRVRSDVTQSA